MLFPSSFRKRVAQQKPIPGTRTSPRTGQVITSSGNPSLDALFGGGLPIGSICLIEEEEKHVTYSRVLVKYFLAEGILSQQMVFLGCLDEEPKELLRKLPKPLNQYEVAKEIADAEQNGEEENKNGLRIAWRYNDLPIINNEQSAPSIGHYFNLLELMHPLLIDQNNMMMWPGGAESMDAKMDDQDDEVITTESEAMADAEEISDEINNTPPSPASAKNSTALFTNSKYTHLLKMLHKLLREQQFLPGGGKKTLCRVCIASLGSPLWYDENFATDMLKFLTVLRALVRDSLVTCLITMPMHLIVKYDESLVPQIRNLVDYAVELESFAGSERDTHPAFKDYSGLLHLHKISAMNALGAYQPETSDLAFKLRRKNFVIEKLHLPPDLQEENTGTDERRPTLSCASSGMIATDTKASLDF